MALDSDVRWATVREDFTSTKARFKIIKKAQAKLIRSGGVLVLDKHSKGIRSLRIGMT